MAQHISRKELKKDEIRETLAHGAEAVISHQRLAAMVIVTAAMVLAVVVAWRYYANVQTEKATLALDEAMKVFQAGTRAPGKGADLNEPDRSEEAAKRFSEVAKKYSRTRPGQLAGYYTALSLEHLGRDDEAQKWLNGVASSGNEEFAALARFQLAELYDRTGKADEAVKLYRKLAEKPTVLVPRSVVLLALADHLSKSDPQEATKLYHQIKKDFPESSAADEADKRLELLGAKT